MVVYVIHVLWRGNSNHNEYSSSSLWPIPYILTLQVTPTADDVLSALWRGNSNRTVAAMKMNARSSRGHAIMYIYVEELNGEAGKRVGKLALVDLAGMAGAEVENAQRQKDRRAVRCSFSGSASGSGSGRRASTWGSLHWSTSPAWRVQKSKAQLQKNQKMPKPSPNKTAAVLGRAIRSRRLVVD